MNEDKQQASEGNQHPHVMDSVDRMLNVFENADEGTLRRIDVRIAELDERLKKLRKMRIAIAKTCGLGPSGSQPRRPSRDPVKDSEDVDRILACVKSEPKTASQVADELGDISYAKVGKLVASSNSLKKNGKLIQVASILLALFCLPAIAEEPDYKAIFRDLDSVKHSMRSIESMEQDNAESLNGYRGAGFLQALSRETTDIAVERAVIASLVPVALLEKDPRHGREILYQLRDVSLELRQRAHSAEQTVAAKFGWRR